MIRTPVRAPKANAIAERLVRTARAERLDGLFILSRRHLERVLGVFVDHYNGTGHTARSTWCRPTRTSQHSDSSTESPSSHVERRDRLGGLIHEYSFAA
jgi:putative transposase